MQEWEYEFLRAEASEEHGDEKLITELNAKGRHKWEAVGFGRDPCHPWIVCVLLKRPRVDYLTKPEEAEVASAEKV